MFMHMHVVGVCTVAVPFDENCPALPIRLLLIWSPYIAPVGKVCFSSII